MYIHLGADVVVRQKDIIGVFDLDTCSISKTTKQFLSNAQKKERLISVSGDIPKSFILCGIKKNEVVYFSQISTATLLKRADFIDDLVQDSPQLGNDGGDK